MRGVLPSRVRLALKYGPYTPPDCRIGDILYCERYGDVEMVAWSSAHITWPLVRRIDGGKGNAAVALTGDLIHAVELESAIAVAHHWGVSTTTVWAWRKVLGVGRITEGTARLYRKYKPRKLTDDIAAAGRAAARGPEARARMSAAKKGRPAHPNTLAALAAACRRPKSTAWIHQLAERNRINRCGIALPHQQGWTAAEDQHLRALVDANHTDREIADMLIRSLAAVRQRRRVTLGIVRRGTP